MALDMLKRSLQLLGTSTINAGKNYFSDVNTFVSDSKAIGAEMKDVISKPFDFVRKMSTSNGGGGLYKFVNDWFYQRTSEFDDGDDDFDSGMPTESHGSGTADTESTTLDTKAMKGIAHQQIGAMYQIGQKQVQANLASTAEIVTNNNARSTEIVTAINNLNKTVMSINQNLSKLVGSAQQEEKYRRTNATNIFSGSNLTLGSVYEAAKTAGGDNPYFMWIKESLESLKQGPSVITDMIVRSIADKIKIGDKSLQEHAEGLNSKFSNFLDSSLSKLMQTSVFKTIFGDDFTRLNTKISTRDEYTRDKAVFDMMTRKTIVDIIPEYLRKITHALTGETWNINNRGKLTTDKVDVIGDSMSAVLQRSAFEYGARNKLTGNERYKVNGTEVPPMVIDQILTWISMGYTVTMLEWASVFKGKENGLNQSPAQMLDKGSEIRRQALEFAFTQYNSKYQHQYGINNESDFEKIFDDIIAKVLFDPNTRKQFAQSVKSNVHSAHNMGVELGDMGYEVGMLDSKTMSQYASKGMDRYDSDLEAALNSKYEQYEKEVNAKDDAALISELKKYGLNPDDFKIGNGLNKRLNKVSAIQALTTAVVEQTREEYKEAHPEKFKNESSKDLEHSLYVRSDYSYEGKEKLNIGSIIYDIRKKLNEGVPVYFIRKPKEQNTPLEEINQNPGKKSGNGGIPSGLNLNTNGCGPIALNDLANRMAMNGSYDPNNGTTIGGFINQANQLGMNLYPGRVTQQALRNTSPNHPLTVMGSGYGFGTLPGQNHYMNITGYGNGYVYTYNPMYGSGYYPVGAIANNSILGLYGSGDEKAPAKEVNINEAVGEAQNLVTESIENLNKALEDIEPTSILGKAALALGISSKSRKAGAKINEKLGTVGEKATYGRSKWRGIKGTVSDYFSYKKQLISDDVHNMLDTAIDNNNRRAAAIERSEEYRKGKLTELNEGSYSEKDRQLAQQALAMMQTALQDGDGQSDLSRIKNVINKIKDRNLRKDLNDNITGMINGAKKNTAKPQSKLGKIVLFGFGLLKKFLSPVFKGAKLIFTGIWKSIKGTFGFVKNYGGKLIKWLARPYLKGAAKVGAGIKGLTQGLFGWTETGADGTTQKRWGLLTPLIKLITEPIKGLIKVAKWLGEKMLWLGGKIGSIVGKAFGFIGGAFKSVFGGMFGGKNKDKKEKKEHTPLTKFGKGLKAGWRGVKDEAKEKAAKFDPKSKENTPATMTDQNTTTIAQLVGNIVSILRGEDPEANKKKEEEEAKKKQQEEQEASKEETSSKAESSGEETSETPPPTLSDINENPEHQTQRKGSGITEGNADATPSQSPSNTGAPTQSSSQTPSNSSNSSPTMPTIETPTTGSNTESSSTAEAGGSGSKSSESSGDSSADNKKSLSTKIGDGLGKVGNVLGKIFGGITSIYGGLFKIVATAAMQLSAFKTLTKLVKEVITTAIKPLNKLFKTLVKEIKPILKTITTTLTELVESAVEVLSVLMESIGPFLEPLFNVVTDIMGGVGQILVEGIGQIVGLLTPAVNFLLKILVPLIKGIHAAIETITGAIQVVMGKLIYGLGAMLTDMNVFELKVLQTIGAKLMREGNQFVESGSDKFYTGVARGIDAVAVAFHGDATVTNNAGKGTSETQDGHSFGGSGSGSHWEGGSSSSSTTVNNIDNSTVNNDNSKTTIDNSTTTTTAPEIAPAPTVETTAQITGSGDTQASYGMFLNMKERGCGPIALAENINRRNFKSVYGSGDIDPRSLASSMYYAGMYSTEKGTSVGDYISTANALGYGMQVGGVDYRSLKQASPTNPITLVGSGAGFGTKQGNTHYINVVGSDGGGYAYVSNPLTGRISKASMSQLALNSKLGIYGGSGDNDEEKKQDSETGYLEDIVNDSTGHAGRPGFGTKLLQGIVGVLPGGYLLDSTIENWTSTFSTPDEKRAALERELATGKYSTEEANNMRKILEDKISGNITTNVTRTEDNTTSPIDDISDVSNIDFSAESIIDRYGTSSTISTLIGGLKDLASNFLSIFNTEDVSTEEGQQKYLKRVKKELGEVKFNIIRAYAFMQFYKEYPPSFLEGLEPGSSSAKIYAARFKLHEYEYFVKYRDTVESNWNNLAPLFPTNELMILAAEIGYGNFATLFGVQSMSDISRLSNLTIPQLAQGICSIIDGLSGEGAAASISRASGGSGGVNSSSAEWNSTTFTQADGLRYRALNYTPRTEAPKSGNEYYDTGGSNPSGGWPVSGGYSGNPLSGRNMLTNCSGYAMGRFHEEVDSAKNGGKYFRTSASRNGGQFINRAKELKYIVDEEGKYPRPGDIISWSYKPGGPGHVGIVEEVPSPDTIIVGHSSYSGFTTLYPSSSSSGTKKGGTATGDSRFYQRTEIHRGNANEMWPLWPSSYHFLGLAHHPGIKYELANSGTSVYEYEGGKIPYTDKMKQYMDNNGDQFAYNWTYNDTNANLFDQSNYHQSAVEAGLTPAEEAYVAGVGIMENGAGKLIGKKSITLVGHDSLGSKNTGKNINDFGINNWRSKQAVGTHDYTYGRTLTEQLKAGFQKNYFGKNPSGPPEDPGARKARNYDVYSGFLPGVIGHPLHLKKGDLWGDYLNTDLAEGTGVGYGSACIGQGWLTERPYARYAGAAIGYWNYMVDRGWINNTQKQEGSTLPTFSSTDWRYAAPTTTDDSASSSSSGSSSSTSSSSSKTTSSSSSKSSTTKTTNKAELTDIEKYTVSGSTYKGNFGTLLNKNGDVIAKIIDPTNYSVNPNAYEQAIKGKTKMSGKHNTYGHEWWYYDTLNGHEIYGAGDTPTTSTYIPKLNISNLYDDILNDGTKQTNNYYIAKDSSDSKREELNILLNHTFNVRSESMEAILTEMLAELKKRGNERTPVSVPSPDITPSLFDDHIPESIVRLMNG